MAATSARQVGIERGPELWIAQQPFPLSVIKRLTYCILNENPAILVSSSLSIVSPQTLAGPVH